MSDPMGIRLEEREPATERANGAQPRAVGSPLSMGSGSQRMNGSSPMQQPTHRFTSPPLIHELPSPPASAKADRALTNGRAHEPASTLQKAINTFRMVMPIVQKVLPLLDGNIGTAVSNLINPQPPAPPPAPPAPKVDLVPLEKGISELRIHYVDLSDRVAEQTTSLKRVEDRLEMVREATDRNTLEQQELLEDLKVFSGKVKVIAYVGLGLLAVVLALNLVLYFHIQRVLP